MIALDLYPDLREKYTDQELFELMSENLKLKPVEAYIGANSNKASIAFEITFQGRTPQKVAQVINEIVSLFLEANLRDREEKAKNTVQFLKKQTEELKDIIRKKEILIAQFKARHQESLPGLYELNRSTLEKLGQQIEQQEENIRRLQDGKAYLQSQLASIPPFLPRPQSRDNDLEFLRKQYIALKATLSENHPDILALKNKIAALEKENYSSELTRATKDDISDIQKQLAILKQKYSVNHPDKIALEKKLNELLQSKQNMGKQSKNKPPTKVPDNPIYLTLRQRLQETKLAIQAEKRELKKLKVHHDKYSKRIENTPSVEQEYKELLRGYNNAEEQYQKNLERLMAAQEGLNLEKKRMSERLTLISPPFVPEKPNSPNRQALLALAVILALGAGLGFGTFMESLDNTVHNSDDLSTLIDKPVLAVIPYLETKADINRQRRKKIIVFGCILTTLILVVSSIHFFYRPLDILFYIITRNLKLIFA